MVAISYKASPTLSTFHADDSFIRCVRGPVGSGKSVGMCWELFGRACRQKPNDKGIRKTRAVVIRSTYPELKSTTIKTYMDWFGDITKIKYNSPIEAVTTLRLPDKTTVELEIFFVSADKEKDIKKFKSLEMTFIWINEASEVPEHIIDVATQRPGRYPSMRDGGPTWRGIIMDTNPPDFDSWWYEAEKAPPTINLQDGTAESWGFFIQPPALIRQVDKSYKPNPDAENIENLDGGYDYYFRQLSKKSMEWVNVFILNRIGSIFPGSFVYPDYNPTPTGNHTTRRYNENCSNLIWTHDQNFTPLSSAIIQRYKQKDGGGYKDYIIDEIVLDSAVAKNSALEFIERYKGYRGIVELCGDVRGNVGAKHGHTSDFELIEKMLRDEGFRVMNRVPTTNGAIKDRQNSLRARLCDAEGVRRLFVNPETAPMADKSLAMTKLKEGSTYQEEDARWQHIGTAIGYYSAIQYPVKGSVHTQFKWVRN